VGGSADAGCEQDPFYRVGITGFGFGVGSDPVVALGWLGAPLLQEGGKRPSTKSIQFCIVR
jgi:hypothetical protein